MEQNNYVLHSNENLEVVCPYCNNSFTVSVNESITVKEDNAADLAHARKTGAIISAVLLVAVLIVCVRDGIIQNKKKKRVEMRWKCISM
jgi:hypothetical protein